LETDEATGIREVEEILRAFALSSAEAFTVSAASVVPVFHAIVS